MGRHSGTNQPVVVPAADRPHHVRESQGGAYQEHYADESYTYHVTGTVVAYEPPRRFAVQRETTGRFGPIDTVDIGLSAEGGQTTVVLVHSFGQLPENRRDEARAFYESGWHDSLRRLAALVGRDPRT